MVIIMRCENGLCLYFENGKCRLDEISIDSLGMCADCMLVSIEEEIIEEKRREQLALLDDIIDN